MQTFLSQTAEYALRAVAWIASRPDDQPVLARDLSHGALIPGQYLSKVLRRLVLAGVLDSRKGRGGGFTLARPAEQISFREVLEAVDAYPREDRCAFGWGACKASRPCPLHETWGAMSGRLRDWATASHFGGLISPGGPPRRAAAAFSKRRRN